MKIVVVSDTHMPRMAKALPTRLRQELDDAELIIHAGDWTSLQVYTDLSRYAKVVGVAGNNDGEAIIKKFGYQKIITCGTKRIGVVHGHLPHPKKTAQQNAAHAFSASDVDVIVFGHSHIPLLKQHDGTLLFNPGSPTAKRRQPQYSFGILTIGEELIRARHVYYDNKE